MKNIFLLLSLISISVSQDLETLLKQAFLEHPSIKAKTAQIAGTNAQQLRKVVVQHASQLVEYLCYHVLTKDLIFTTGYTILF